MIFQDLYFIVLMPSSIFLLNANSFTSLENISKFSSNLIDQNVDFLCAINLPDISDHGS